MSAGKSGRTTAIPHTRKKSEPMAFIARAVNKQDLPSGKFILEAGSIETVIPRSAATPFPTCANCFCGAGDLLFVRVKQQQIPSTATPK